MSELRKDILTGEWVVFATNRLNKPYYFNHEKSSIDKVQEKCPFCLGEEHQTPKEIYRHEDETAWDIRVFNNLYPAVGGDISWINDDDFYRTQAGNGIHEVVVDTPKHNEEIYDFTNQHLVEILKVLKTRFEEMEKDDLIEYVQIFKNNGRNAGASIPHSHWQIMGIPYVPKKQEEMLRNMKEYTAKESTCLICDIQKKESGTGTRVIMENQEFVVFVPYAAYFAFEMWIVPKKHISSYKNFDEKQLEDLAKTLLPVLKKMQKLRTGIGFNLCFQDKPKNSRDNEFHWFLRILPRIGAPAGFEFATGSYINPIFPEDAAKKIKSL